MFLNITDHKEEYKDGFRENRERLFYFGNVDKARRGILFWQVNSFTAKLVLERV